MPPRFFPGARGRAQRAPAFSQPPEVSPSVAGEKGFWDRLAQAPGFSRATRGGVEATPGAFWGTPRRIAVGNPGVFFPGFFPDEPGGPPKKFFFSPGGFSQKIPPE